MAMTLVPVAAACVSSTASARSSVIAASSSTRMSTPARPGPSSIRLSQDAMVREGMPASASRPAAATAARQAPA
jgi:hypothetical protein